MTQTADIPGATPASEVLAIILGGLGTPQTADIIAAVRAQGAFVYAPGGSDEYAHVDIAQAVATYAPRKVALIGHSLACDTVITGAAALAQAGKPVDYLGLLEPVWADKTLPAVGEYDWFQCDAMIDFPKARVKLANGVWAFCVKIHGDHNSICHDPGVISSISDHIRRIIP